MKTPLYGSFLVLLCASIWAQKPRYDCYEALMKDGLIFAKDPGTFRQALGKFNAARRCDPSKSDFVDSEINELFTKILILKKEADQNAKKAKAESIKAQQAKIETDKALKKITEEQVKNERIISAFYFYGDSLALSVKYNAFMGYKYGFINKDGKVLIDYQFDEASSFNLTDGYARVKKSGKKYLLDPRGKLYPLVETVEDMTDSTTALDLHNKNLRAIPETVFQHSQLQILLLSQNQLNTLPTQINKLTNLQTLDLSSNHNLNSLPDEIGALGSLESLFLGGNPLSNLPKEIGALKNLQRLNLSGTALSSLRKEIGTLTNLQMLDLGYNLNLRILPKELWSLKNLQSLSLSYNRNLSTLPKELWFLKSLQSLSLFFNDSLSSLPKEFENLKNLQSIYISGNSLISLPKELWGIENLQKLTLNGTSLSSLPGELWALKNLQGLSLLFNPQIKELPKEIDHLTNLQSLVLSFNSQLKKLPKEIGNLTNLQILNLSYNDSLASLPKELGQLTQLQTLDLRGCPIPEEEKKKIKNWLPNCQVYF